MTDTPETVDDVIRSVRFPAADDATVVQAAQIAGQPVSTYVREVAAREARETLARAGVVLAKAPASAPAKTSTQTPSAAAAT